MAVLALVALGGFGFSLFVGDRIVPGVEGAASPGRGIFRPARGEGAPDFTLRDLNGQQVSLSGLRGKPVLLFFWTTF